MGKEIGKRVFKAHMDKHSCGYSWPIELTQNYVGGSDSYQLDVYIDVDNKKIEVLGFHYVANEEQQKIFERNGIK